MSFKDVTQEDIIAVGARYKKVLSEMEEDRLSTLRKYSGFPELKERLLLETTHSEDYIKYSLSRRFTSLNIMDLLGSLKDGPTNLVSLRNILLSWESYSEASRLFNASDELDLPYAFLNALLNISWSCPECSKFSKFLSIIKSKDFTCSCGHKDPNFTTMVKRSVLLPAGFYSDTSEAYCSVMEGVIL